MNVSMTKRDVEIFLLMVKSGGYITPKQLAGSRLFKSEKKSRERLYSLYCCGYLGRFRRQKIVVRGSAEYIYFCKRKCDTISSRLTGLGTTTKNLPKHSVEHILLLNDIILQFRYHSNSESYDCDFIPEFDRDKLPYRTNRENVIENPFIPDGVGCLTNKTGKKQLLFLELDMGTIPLELIKRKINQYIDYYTNGSYKNFNITFQYAFSGFRLLYILCTNRTNNILKVATELGAIDFVWMTDVQEVLTRNLKGILHDKIWIVAGDKTFEKRALVGE